MQDWEEFSHIKGTRYCVGSEEARGSHFLNEYDVRLIIVVMGPGMHNISKNGLVEKCYRNLNGEITPVKQIIYDLADLPGSNILPIVEDAFVEVKKFLESEKEGNILFHCVAGISRSPSLVIGILMKEGMRYDDAYELVLKYRPCIEPNPGFVYQLSTLDTTLIKLVVL